VSLTDIFQVISLAVVAIALFLTVWQNRQLAKQTAETARQASFAAAAVRQASYQEATRRGVDFTTAAIGQDPDLLAWFLESRGFLTSSATENRRRLYIWTRIDIHEMVYLERLEGLTPDNVWVGWRRALELDATTIAFAEVWGVVKSHYATDFAAHVDQLLDRRNQAAASGTVAH
jgi:hypothetical protein